MKESCCPRMKLYERFGRENGGNILGQDFFQVEWMSYQDSLVVPDPEPLISYVLSCHGNQSQYILDHYNEFRSYVKKEDGRRLPYYQGCRDIYL